jgi:hypothetical protein
MKTSPSSQSARLTFLALPLLTAVAFAVGPACSSASNPAPPGTSSVSSTASSGATGTGGATSSTTGTGGTASGTGGATSGTGGTGGTGFDAGPPCVSDGGDAGCYSCPPTNTNEFLNACAGSTDQCTHFDNATRLPAWDGGALPPIQ